MKQTAVEWLVEQVNTDCLNSTFIQPKLIEEAKQMEKTQIRMAYNDGAMEAVHGKYRPQEEYYNERYGK